MIRPLPGCEPAPLNVISSPLCGAGVRTATEERGELPPPPPPVTVAVLPPAAASPVAVSWTAVRTEYLPGADQVWVPETVNWPGVLVAVTVPADFPPSPQVIVAENSD